MESTKQTEREIKTITSTNGHIVGFYTYIEGGEWDDIRIETLRGMPAPEDGEKVKFTLDQSIVFYKACMQRLIVSLDGKTEGAMNEIKKLPSAEYDDVVAQIRKEAKLSF